MGVVHAGTGWRARGDVIPHLGPKNVVFYGGQQVLPPGRLSSLKFLMSLFAEQLALGLDAAAEQYLMNISLLNTLKCVLVNVLAEPKLSRLPSEVWSSHLVPELPWRLGDGDGEGLQMHAGAVSRWSWIMGNHQ